MNSIMKYQLYTAVIMALSVSSVCGQTPRNTETKRPDTLRRELTIVNDQTVEMERADPLPATYKAIEPRLKPFRPEYNKRTFGFVPEVSSSGMNNLPNILPAEGYMKHRGYLNIGLGHTLNQRVDAGYRLIDAEQERLNLFLSYRGMKSAFNTGDFEGDRKDRRMMAGVDYEQRRPSFVLATGLYYTNHYFNHYGRGATTNVGSIPQLSAPVTPQMDNGTHNVRAYLGAKNDVIDARIDYRFFRSIPYLGTDPMKALTEHTPELNVEMRKELSDDVKLGLQVRTGGLFFAKNSEMIQTGVLSETDRNLYYVEGAPTIGFVGDSDNMQWNIQAGVGVSSHFGAKGRLFFWPKLDASLSIFPSWRLYAKAFGGVIRNGLADVMQEEMPYLMPNTIVLPSRNALTAQLGVKGNIADVARMEVYGDFSKLTGVPFYTPTLPLYNPSDLYQYNVSFLPIYADGSRWRAGGKLEYSYRDMLRFLVDASYGKWNLDGGLVASMQPDLILKAEVGIHPIAPLDVRLRYTQLNGRYRYSFGSVFSEALGVGNVHLLSADVSYKLKKNLGLYLKIDNMLAETTELIGYYPMQPFHCFAGFSWTF